MKRLAILLFVAAACYGQTLPNPKLTPGLVRQLSTKEVCETKWGLDRRHVTQKMKEEVCKAYGAKDCPGPKWELDHFQPRELAGADDKRNLWAQKIEEARMKDRLESYLHRQVCAGKLSLHDAQEMIRQNWYVAYQQIPKPKER